MRQKPKASSAESSSRNVLSHVLVEERLHDEHEERRLALVVYSYPVGNRSSFSKQLEINCTCEQIGLSLISTRGNY